jgi:hypothetical protein
MSHSIPCIFPPAAFAHHVIDDTRISGFAREVIATASVDRREPREHALHRSRARRHRHASSRLPQHATSNVRLVRSTRARISPVITNRIQIPVSMN